MTDEQRHRDRPSGPWNAVESPAGMNHEHLLLFLAGTDVFFLSHGQRQEGSRGGAILTGTGKRNRNSACSPMFPEHVSGTLRENPSLGGTGASCVRPWLTRDVV